MTRDAIAEGNRLLTEIDQAKRFWDYHKSMYNVPDSLKSRIDSVIEQYIYDQEWRLDQLSAYFEYEDGDNDETI